MTADVACLLTLPPCCTVPALCALALPGCLPLQLPQRSYSDQVDLATCEGAPRASASSRQWRRASARYR
eukprot:COSAG01_NODE_2319_length_7913_cov_82.271052_10_plen_69_part_00